MKTVTEVVYSTPGTHLEPLPSSGSVAELFVFLRKQLDEIPDQYRCDAAYRLGAEVGYDGPEVYLTITYERPEEDCERVLRERREEQAAESRASVERQEYLRLKKKFEEDRE